MQIDGIGFTAPWQTSPFPEICSKSFISYPSINLRRHETERLFMNDAAHITHVEFQKLRLGPSVDTVIVSCARINTIMSTMISGRRLSINNETVHVADSTSCQSSNRTTDIAMKVCRTKVAEYRNKLGTAYSIYHLLVQHACCRTIWIV